MTRLFLGLVAGACGGLMASADPAGPLSRAPAKAPDIGLSDQFGQAWHLGFPRARPSLLTVADRKGSDQVLLWVRPVHESFPDQVEVHGIAHVGSVPKVFRGRIERGFRETYPRPILLDWSGELTRDLGCLKDQATIFLVDCDGTILNRWHGFATGTALAALTNAVQRLLSLRPPASSGITNSAVLPAQHR